MKNCLSVIVAIGRLVEGELSPRGRERIARLQAASARLRDLLARDLCEASEAPESPIRPRAACVATLVAAVAARLSDRAEQANVGLATQCPGGRIVGHEADLQEALFNVVANAIEATPPGGNVLVRTEVTRDEDHVWSVTDTGPGIPLSRLVALGRPFATGRAEGSGLGLAFARKVVARHGGAIHVESAAGEGTRVSLWLPAEP